MLIEIYGVKKKYGKKKILRGVDLICEGGQCVGILGANGSGKSTLLGILARILLEDGGKFYCDGIDLIKDYKRHSNMVGYVPQHNPLMEELTAKDNLLMWYTNKEIYRELKDGVLKYLGIGEFLHVPVCKMSGGMKKRLSIGCAMAKRPPILLMDEPTAALDLACKEWILSYLKAYKASGGLILLATHDALELELCDHIHILKDGVLEQYAYDGDLHKLVQSL